ncbi:SMI1/KNR4 family protein [Paenibacillus rubinfantis]|jgi:hypothetical protein|uniref:SMI1/KNR4 family protein n=1 Tax=Paenibacillus rubinfantis TaxID=1720296 RepID=UPI00073ECA03|nr:SMI1/KNR4 family protein [Paenibacillus rubinfantis]
MGNKIEWQSGYNPADIDVIRTVEKNFGILFPDDFLEVVQKYQGGQPSSKILEVNDRKVVFGYLLTFLAFDELDILDKYNSERYTLPPKHFPFAVDEEGNMFCFDYSGSDSPVVVYVESNKGSTASTIYLAQNFLGFVELLK